MDSNTIGSFAYDESNLIYDATVDTRFRAVTLSPLEITDAGEIRRVSQDAALAVQYDEIRRGVREVEPPRREPLSYWWPAPWGE